MLLCGVASLILQLLGQGFCILVTQIQQQRDKRVRRVIADRAHGVGNAVDLRVPGLADIGFDLLNGFLLLDVFVNQLSELRNRFA